MAHQVKVHWLRENARNATPHRVLVFDTETRPRSEAEPDAQVLRLWSARLIRRHDVEPKLPRVETFDGTTAAELAALVDRLTTRDRTTWLFAHNLSFDLAVTALPVELTALGWRLTEGALTSDSPWCRMARKDRRLTVADTWSWMPASVEVIAGMVGKRKLVLPSWGASDDEWRARCRRDVEVCTLAIEQIMDWWDQGGLGNWSVTGPASGWSTYRHRRPAPRVLVDPDPDARAFEARAITGGRREARRTGELPRGLYADLDLATAHLTVMASQPLPARRFKSFDQLPLESPMLRSRIFDVLAECELEVQTPRYPWDSGRGVFYPVGRFRTVLAGPEIREAQARGELRSIGRGTLYHVRAHMAGWAIWLAQLIAQETPGVPPVVRLLAKHWSRCVPGKWAGHTSEVIRKTPDPRPGWSVERGAIDGGRRAADFLRLGGELWTIARDEWADDAFPAILAFIQSYTRVALGRMLDQLGPAVVSCNTDGVLVDVWRWRAGQPRSQATRRPSGDQALRELDAWCQDVERDLAAFQVRIKGAWSQVTILGPQHLVLGAERRLAGIPRRAIVLADGRYSFTAWPKLRVQLIPDGPPVYRTEARTVSLAKITQAGWLLQDGSTRPIRTDIRQDQATILAPEPAELGDPPAAQLAPVKSQHVALRPVLRAAEALEHGPQDRPGQTIPLQMGAELDPPPIEAGRRQARSRAGHLAPQVAAPAGTA